MTLAVPLWSVSLKCCFAFGSNSILEYVNPIKILIWLSMLGYPFEGILDGLVAPSPSFLVFHQETKKVLTTSCVSECSSVPNILEPLCQMSGRYETILVSVFLVYIIWYTIAISIRILNIILIGIRNIITYNILNM